MGYIEFLRLRRAFYWYGGVLVGVTLLGLVSLNLNATHVERGNPGELGISGVFAIAVYCGAVFATVISRSLNKENDGVEMVWTKPVSRQRLALQYFAYDLGAIVVATLLAALLMSIVLLDVGAIMHTPVSLVVFDAQSTSSLALGLGVAFMWYGLLQAATAWSVNSAALAVGLSWGLFAALIAFSHTPPSVFHSIVMALNVLNPLAYMTAVTFSDAGGVVNATTHSIFAGNIWQRAGIAWAIGLAACAGAIALWKRLEV
jgi:hypothetical protein